MTALLWARNSCASCTCLASDGSSSESDATARPLPLYFLCISTTCGKFSLHGPHHVAQASTSVYLASLFAIRSRNSSHFTGSSLASPTAPASLAGAAAVVSAFAGLDSGAGAAVIDGVEGAGVGAEDEAGAEAVSSVGALQPTAASASPS